MTAYSFRFAHNMEFRDSWGKPMWGFADKDLDALKEEVLLDEADDWPPPWPPINEHQPIGIRNITWPGVYEPPEEPAQIHGLRQCERENCHNLLSKYNEAGACYQHRRDWTCVNLGRVWDALLVVFADAIEVEDPLDAIERELNETR